MDRTDAIVFDAYGTLFDVHAAVTRHAARIGPKAPALSALWRDKQLEYAWVLSLAGRYESFSTLTERALDHALLRHGFARDVVLRGDLLAAYRRLDPYPEVPLALARLKDIGRGIAILSNGDPAMLADAVEAAGLGWLIPTVVSVEAAGVFKPSPRTYALALDALGLPPQRVLFVSSNRWDVAGAAAFGLPTAWVNRGGLPDEYPDLAPGEVVSDLDGLVLSIEARDQGQNRKRPLW